MDRAQPASGGRWPVVVLAYAYSGVARLEDLLASSVLTCTSGTGLVPLCAEAADAWQRVDDRAGPMSQLAASSVRALVSNMITVILARSGGSRWCEISFSPPSVAETFLRLFPGARFLCWHRDCRDVMRAGVQANPWGLAGRGLAPFVAAHPGSSAAALAAYWAESTEALLLFEEAHADASRRLTYEDLTRHPDRAAAEISVFLDLDAADSLVGGSSGLMAWPPDDDACTENGGNGQEAKPAGLQLPASHLPKALVDRVNGLQARLGYAPLALASPAR
jgi:hypothetical protein